MHLKYASVLWNPHLSSDINSLENMQKFALTVCMKPWDANYAELLSTTNLAPFLTTVTCASKSVPSVQNY